jgi:hypothetical protein
MPSTPPPWPKAYGFESATLKRPGTLERQGHRLTMNDSVYPPEIIELMTAAFDAAYEQLFGEPTQALQLQLATRIMAAINNGIRDHDQLVAIALGEVTLEADEAPDVSDDKRTA